MRVQALTLNLFIGFSVPVGLREPSRALAQFQRTDAEARLRALARFLTLRRPAFVGLQEVVRLTALGTAHEPGFVLVDFLASLHEALAEEGGPAYQSHAHENIFVQSVVPFGAEPRTLRFSESNVLLVDPRFEVLEHRARPFETLASMGEHRVLRGWQHARVRLEDGRRLELFNTHLEVVDESVRRSQALELLEALEAAADGEGSVLLLGDLNAVPGSAVLRTLTAAGLVDTFAAAGSGPGTTCCQSSELDNPQDHTSVRIDYVLFRPGPGAGARIESSEVVLNERVPLSKGPGRIWPSDHFGVLTAIELQGPP